jgi:NADH-quinone oxidoreductase subunit L
MIAIVSFVSLFVHLYAVFYMAGDRGMTRFMSFLSLFTFFMLMLVSADNLLQLFFGWEGVGLMSYLLIGFWYEKPAASSAGMKAFLMNRAGDVGFVLGMIAIAQLFGSLRFVTIFHHLPEVRDAHFVFLGYEIPALTAIGFLLFAGACAKSAQIGLHTWLPDAMEGPTPVSALIHAATMVTAGVFLIARLSPLFESVPDVLFVIGCFGAATALFAGVVASAQTDIKRVIAYSTMSQLGFMFMALGVSAYGAALFHLATHAFFKALLFLGAGSVIHALRGEQDLRKMGGLWRKMPVTYALMLIGMLALAGVGIDGVFGFSGFYSKDLILNAALAHGGYGVAFYGVGVAAAVLTAFYSLRLIVLAFYGSAEYAHAHESSWALLAPLIPLAIGAILFGFFGETWFAGADRALFWKKALVDLGAGDPIAAIPSLGLGVRLIPVGAALIGFALAWFLYVKRPDLLKKSATPVRAGAQKFNLGGATAVLRFIRQGFGVDALYAALIQQPIEMLGRVFWNLGDEKIIDGLGPDGSGRLAQRVGRLSSSFQTGLVYHYAFAMVAGLVLFMTWFWFF